MREFTAVRLRPREQDNAAVARAEHRAFADDPRMVGQSREHAPVPAAVVGAEYCDLVRMRQGMHAVRGERHAVGRDEQASRRQLDHVPFDFRVRVHARHGHRLLGEGPRLALVARPRAPERWAGHVFDVPHALLVVFGPGAVVGGEPVAVGEFEDRGATVIGFAQVVKQFAFSPRAAGVAGTEEHDASVLREMVGAFTGGDDHLAAA